MKTFLFPFFALAAACLPAAAFEKPTANPSTLPMKVVPADIASTRAFESGDRLFVTGALQKTLRHVPRSAHVDIRLIGAGGRLIAEKQDDIEPSHPRLAPPKSYVVSFPLSEARKAKLIHVQYHTEGHP